MGGSDISFAESDLLRKNPTISEYGESIELAGTFENQMLYRMCAEKPSHTDSRIIAGKLISIGRIYAASPERGVRPSWYDGTSFVEHLGRQLKKSNLDERLSSLDAAGFFELDPEQPVRVHRWLVKELRGWFESTSDSNARTRPRKAREHRSFVSKYLHFHRPNVFPIMDSFATKGLRAAGHRVSGQNYCTFCPKIRLFGLVQERRLMTLRELDMYLVEQGRLAS